MMTILRSIAVILLAGFILGCQTTSQDTSHQEPDRTQEDRQARDSEDAAASINTASENTSDAINRTASHPRSVRDFFMLLPEKYFVVESCDRNADKFCQKAKLAYLKDFGQIEDRANGYLKGGCDGAQSCLELTIFRRPDSSYIVAVSTESEMIIDQYFLDYADGKWIDISSKVIPEYSKNNLYELPHKGTLVKVFSKRITESGPDYEIAEKGERLYDLEWKDGKFSVKR